MCYGPLTDGSATERPITSLLRSELVPAVRNGVLAAAIVLGVLLFEGTPVWLILWSAIGAVVLGTVLHQFVLLAGTVFIRFKIRWVGSQTLSVQ